MKHAAGTVALLLLLPVLAFAGQLWRVAPQPGPGIDFSGGQGVQAAVDAAADGDVILVAAGAYDVVVVDGKGVRIFGTGALLIDLDGGSLAEDETLTVRNLGPSQSFVLDGFTVFLGAAGTRANILLEDNAGAIWLQGLFVDSYGATSLLAERSSSIVVIDSLLQTNLVPAAADGTPQTGPGVELLDGSALYAYGASFVGSHGALSFGGTPTPNGPAPGGPGVRLVDSALIATGGQVSGGAGNSFFDGACSLGADGGAGIRMETAGGAAPTAILQATQVTGGSSGFFDPGCGGAPQAGAAFDVTAGTVVPLAGSARDLALPARIAWGTTVPLVLTGAPNDVALLFSAPQPGPALPAPGLDFHLGLGGLFLVGAFPLGPDGTETLPLTMPNLQGTGFFLPFTVQAFHVDTTPAIHTTGPRMSVVS